MGAKRRLSQGEKGRGSAKDTPARLGYLQLEVYYQHAIYNLRVVVASTLRNGEPVVVKHRFAMYLHLLKRTKRVAVLCL